MYIKKYWNNYIGGTDDSLNLVAFLEDQKKDEITLNEIFTKIGMDKQNWDFHQTMEYLEFTHSNGMETDFHYAIDLITDLAAILLECSVNGSVDLHDLDEYYTPFRIRITATVEEHDAVNKALSEFVKDPLSYDLSEMVDEEDMFALAQDCEEVRKELYESNGINRNYNMSKEDLKEMLTDWKSADGCFATNRIMVEGCKVGYCYREEPDGDWDSGWRFMTGDESQDYMNDPNNTGIYRLNTVCNSDPDIIPLLTAPYNSAFERNENGSFQHIKNWEPGETREEQVIELLKQCQKWHEDNEHQKIVEVLETIPAKERTPEMDMELARAYNNLGTPLNKENEESEQDSKGTFAGFVLLSKGKWNKKQLIQDLTEKWGIIAQEDENEENRDDSLVFNVGNMIAAVSLMTYPIPNGEAEANAENNYMWTEAVKIAKQHKAHIMVAVLSKDENDLLERGKLYTKLIAACCHQKYATGVYTSGVVFEPQFYEDIADMMQDGELPIFNWIWFGLYRSEQGICGYTYGMSVFGKDEMEVLDADAEPGDLRDFLASVVSYVLKSDVKLQDGDTIGFSADDKHTITRSNGVSLPYQMTLKISYESFEDSSYNDEYDTDNDVNLGEESIGTSEAYTEDNMSTIEQHIDKNTIMPSKLAQAMMDYLDCECTYFPSMEDDSKIISAYRCARKQGSHEGFVPMLVAVDEILWETLIINSDPNSDGADNYTFNADNVANYRREMLSQKIEDGKILLDTLIKTIKSEIEEDDIDWEKEILGKMENGYENYNFSGYWDYNSNMTYPLILAKIPVKNPWEIFAYLPFGNWNDCPNTLRLMSVVKYWFEQYGAVPVTITHDILEIELPAPVLEKKAMDVAVEQYGFCPDVAQNFEKIGMLADTLRQSNVWFLWWD